MSISNKLTELNSIKQGIKQAIVDKGVDMTGVDFSGYAGKIDEISLPKEEQTKTVAEPNFSSGNVVITPDTDKVLTQVTVVKDNDLVPENIVKDVNIFGVVGTAETGGGASGGYDLEIRGDYGIIDVYVKDINNTTDYYQVSGMPNNTVYLKNITWVKLVYYGSYINTTGLTENQALSGHTLTQNSSIVTNHD